MHPKHVGKRREQIVRDGDRGCAHISECGSNSDPDGSTWHAACYVWIYMKNGDENADVNKPFETQNLTSEVYGLLTRADAENWVESEHQRLSIMRDLILEYCKESEDA